MVEAGEHTGAAHAGADETFLAWKIEEYQADQDRQNALAGNTGKR